MNFVTVAANHLGNNVPSEPDRISRSRNGKTELYADWAGKRLSAARTVWATCKLWCAAAQPMPCSNIEAGENCEHGHSASARGRIRRCWNARVQGNKAAPRRLIRGRGLSAAGRNGLAPEFTEKVRGARPMPYSNIEPDEDREHSHNGARAERRQVEGVVRPPVN